MSTMVCSACGTIGTGKKVLQGSAVIELLLYLFIVPGLIYSAWRSQGPRVCRSCGKPSLIPKDSPMAKKLLADTGQA